MPSPRRLQNYPRFSGRAAAAPASNGFSGGTMNAFKWAHWWVVCVLTLIGPTCRLADLEAQATPETVSPLLEKPVQVTGVTAYQLQRYMMKQVARPAVPETAEAWTREEESYRKHILEDVAFHGWPQEWIHSAPHF